MKATALAKMPYGAQRWTYCCTAWDWSCLAKPFKAPRCASSGLVLLNDGCTGAVP